MRIGEDFATESPYVPEGFEVCQPPPPQATSLGVVELDGGWTSEAFEDYETGIQYIEYYNSGTGEMMWYCSGAGDVLAVTEERWDAASGGSKWMWAGIAAGIGAVGGLVVQRTKFPQYNAAVTAAIGAIVLGGVGYFAAGAMKKNGAVSGRIGRRRGRRRMHRLDPWGGQVTGLGGVGLTTPADIQRANYFSGIGSLGQTFNTPGDVRRYW